MKNHLWTGAFVCATAFLSASCNVYDPFDSPTSDAQLVSAARACLDQGDYACARDNYQKLSTVQSDIATSELAFTALDEVGLGMKAFATAFGKGAGVSAFNKLVASVAPNASRTTRLAIYNNAFLKWQSIQNTELRALVKFVSSAALAAEVLGEASGGDAITKEELATNPTACEATTTTTCAASSACAKPSGTGNNLEFGTTTIDLAVTEPSGTNPDLLYFNSAVTYANEGLQELGVSGSFLTQLFTGD